MTNLSPSGCSPREGEQEKKSGIVKTQPKQLQCPTASGLGKLGVSPKERHLYMPLNTAWIRFRAPQSDGTPTRDCQMVT
jgi:hypothetical protein